MALSTSAFDSAVVLDTPEAISEYLDDAFESQDPAIISHALGVVARAMGMSELSAKTGLTRQSLYKALSIDGNPEFATVMKVAKAFGYRLSAEPIEEREPHYA